jgi:hypothetical protein
MAALRNLVISILRMAGHVSIAALLRHTARDPLRAVRLLTGRKSRSVMGQRNDPGQRTDDTV